MKKVYGLLIALTLILLTGCTKVEEGKYKEGTYFGADLSNKHTAVVYVDNTGKVKSVLIDAIYGKKQADGTTSFTTKQMLGDDYAMKQSSPVGKEWYEQVKLLSDKVVAEQGLDWLVFKYRVTNANGDFEYTETKPADQTEEKKIYTDSVAGVTINISPSYNAIKDALTKALK
jgi:hypothetical protein